MSAEIIWLWGQDKAEIDLKIDLRTAVDVAIRDLQEIETQWGTAVGFERLLECRAMLRHCLQFCGD